MAGEFCATCGERAIASAQDGRGNTIYGYSCTAEVVVSKEGVLVRTIKECPDWGGNGRSEKLLRERRGC